MTQSLPAGLLWGEVPIFLRFDTICKRMVWKLSCEGQSCMTSTLENSEIFDIWEGLGGPYTQVLIKKKIHENLGLLNPLDS